MHRSTFLAVATTLAAACGENRGSSAVTTSDDGLCDTIIQRAKECLEGQFTQDESDGARTECEMRHQAFLTGARDGVEAAVARCVAPLTCEEFESFDDRCFPVVVADFAEGVIPPETVDACVIDRNSEACESFLRTREESAPGVIGECLARHIACADANTWVALIDPCVSLALLDEPARERAQACIAENSCDDVKGCLEQRGAINW